MGRELPAIGVQRPSTLDRARPPVRGAQPAFRPMETCRARGDTGPLRPCGLRRRAGRVMASELRLPALEPSHPAAFLGALGALDLVATSTDARLSWQREGVTWRPKLTLTETVGPNDLVEVIAAAH